MKALFVETSALLNVLFRETGYESTLKKLQSADRIIASRLIRIEAERAILRAALANPKVKDKIKFEFETVLKSFWSKFDFLEITKEICNAAGVIAPESNLRSLDAIHLVSYFWLKSKDPNIELLSFDQKIVSSSE